ncbi:MAG: Dihydropteroate synthase [Myxococcaceae bacterium]|nr:Dihydropteroate synthase [Myxococcaceae bacterium]
MSKRGVALMGICNVTPDSFSDGGDFFSREAAFSRVDLLLAEGADIVDIGGESTRPAAPEVPPAEQLARVLDVVRHAAARCRERKNGCVSIDTQSPEVARACLEAGAAVVNDVSCLRDDALARVTAEAHAAFVLMHSRGSQENMPGFGKAPADAYGTDVVATVAHEWSAAAERALAQGVEKDVLYMDPGLGFAKAAPHSEELLRRLTDLCRAVGAPVLVGASRKSFLKLTDPDAEPRDRLGASLAAAVYAAANGAAIVRVHDVRATRQAIDFMRRMQTPQQGQVP